MKKKCPPCPCKDCPQNTNNLEPKVKRNGKYYSRDEEVQRYICMLCGRTYSDQTFDLTYRMKKPEINAQVIAHLVSHNTQAHTAALCNVSEGTIASRVKTLGKYCGIMNKELLKSKSVNEVVFDELITFEHSRLKQLSILLMVEKDTRYILHCEQCTIPTSGTNSKIAKAKYGKRLDHRPRMFSKAFEALVGIVGANATFHSDEATTYPEFVRRYFPEASHQTYKGRKAIIAGTGEMKEGGWDPLFDVNHTAAMLRANIATLTRRTWCTVKQQKRLQYLLNIYVYVHNLARDKEEKLTKTVKTMVKDGLYQRHSA